MENKKSPEGLLKNTVEVSSIRVPSTFYEEIKECSNDCGNSMNGTMLMLIKLGLKVYNAEFKVTLETKQ